MLVSYLIYIKEQRSRNNSLINMEELKAVAHVLTNQGVKNPATDNVHFSPAYGAGIDLLRHLPGERGKSVCCFVGMSQKYWFVELRHSLSASVV